MSGGWAPWRTMLPVWLPAVLLCLASMAVYGWLSSESLGREALLRTRVAELEAKLEQLKQIRQSAADERQLVSNLESGLERLQVEVFGSLDDRLTGILRSVGTATHDAGLRVGRYSYSAEEIKDLDLSRFGIQFTVAGEYAQVRRMLAALQASPEFLVVNRIGFSGEEGATTRELQIGVRLSTYLGDAASDTLRELTESADTGGPAEAATAVPAAGAATDGTSDG